ncbi:hypothetical protein EC845_1198 [Comamonas sp. BIGb0124]|uniref:hypothetical protein n=1 Tax=Comamonas sp. BIGb0124 TaxID=2485130 RepID=UPI000F48D6B4|nr:hypothetical protein [Comamonas sp. BIGb0124]ROR25158.1 hypothetical protein EC845_1198 [Comamonas sp. BIGb0124]
MADNVQQQILEAVQLVLKTADLGVVDVHLDHPNPLSLVDQLPAIEVEAGPEGETVSGVGVSSLEERVFAVRVACLVAQLDGYAAAARSLGAAVERLLAEPTFMPAGKKSRCRLNSSEIVLTSNAERPMAAYQQIWRVTYFTRRGAPDIPF